MSLTYEIARRETGQHRPGRACLLIEGLDADLTVDPAQFLPYAEREALKLQGLDRDPRSMSIPELFALQAPPTFDPAKFAIDVDRLCQKRADKALQRRIDRLRYGLPVGGVDLGQRNTGGISAGTASDMARRPRMSEKQSVEQFLNRGILRGLTKDERLARAKRKAQRHDSDAEWRANRAALIARREEDLKHWEAELAKHNPKAERWVRLLRDELAALRSPVRAASHGFQSAYAQYLTEGVQLATDDIRIWPLMTNTTIDTVRDGIDTFSEATADEFDGSNYSAGGLALDSQAVTEDDANDRAEFDAADEVVSALGAGTRSIQGVALGLFNTNTAGSRVLHWIEFASNKTPDGSDFTFAFNAEGILQAADG